MYNKLPLIILFTILLGMGNCSKKVAVLPETIQEIGPTLSEIPDTRMNTSGIVTGNKTNQPMKTASYQFRDIYFDYDRYELKSEAIEILSEHARQLKKNQNIKVLIEGHCDEWGTIEYNLALGERRSNSVKSFLVKYGISPDRLSTISYGKERPLDPEHNASAWAKNRRAVLVIGS